MGKVTIIDCTQKINSTTKWGIQRKLDAIWKKLNEHGKDICVFIIDADCVKDTHDCKTCIHRSPKFSICSGCDKEYSLYVKDAGI